MSIKGWPVMVNIRPECEKHVLLLDYYIAGKCIFSLTN